jgi:hypothetical protein
MIKLEENNCESTKEAKSVTFAAGSMCQEKGKLSSCSGDGDIVACMWSPSSLSCSPSGEDDSRTSGGLALAGNGSSKANNNNNNNNKPRGKSSKISEVSQEHCRVLAPILEALLHVCKKVIGKTPRNGEKGKRSGYIEYSTGRREQLLREFPELRPKPAQVMRRLAAEWQELPAEKKKEFTDQAQKRFNERPRGGAEDSKHKDESHAGGNNSGSSGGGGIPDGGMMMKRERTRREVAPSTDAQLVDPTEKKPNKPLAAKKPKRRQNSPAPARGGKRKRAAAAAATVADSAKIKRARRKPSSAQSEDEDSSAESGQDVSENATNE